MSTCSWSHRVEAFHDGEMAMVSGLQEHLDGCDSCREYLGVLEQLRAGVALSKKEVEISDAQFRVFMDGVRDGIEAKRFSWARLFTRMSLVAAGLVLVASLTYIASQFSEPVRVWAWSFISPTVEVHDAKPGQLPGNSGDVNPATKGDI